MMLTTKDLLLIILTAGGCTAGVTLLALGVLGWGKRWSFGVQTVVIVIAAVLSIVASTVAISAEMYLSPHDLQVLLWVIAIATVMSIAAAIVTARVARRSFAALVESVQRVGDGEVVATEHNSRKELTELSRQLADTSRRLADARAEIERIDVSRRQFFAWISHDLRTPLAGISALSEALEDDMVEHPGDYLRQIRGQVTTMSRLVDDLFELSQIQSGTLRLRVEDIELLDIVSDAVADVHPLADAREIRIAHAGVEGQTIQADAHELTRAVVNLLTNSVRHAPTDSEILITAVRHDDHLILSVRDQGDGVDSRDLTRMFDIGWRAGTARTPIPNTDGSTGAGLGLAIVQGIIEAHGGHVNAENVEQGFRLNVALPAAPDRQGRGLPASCP